MASGKDTLYLFMTVTDSSVNLITCQAYQRIDDTTLTIAGHRSDTSPYIPHQHTIFVFQSPIDGFADFGKYRQQISLRITSYGKSRVFEVRCFLETFALQICSRFFRNAYNVGNSSPLGLLVLGNAGKESVSVLKETRGEEDARP